MADKVILVGGFHETIELCELCDFSIVGIIDNKLVNEYMGYHIIGTDDDAKRSIHEIGNIPLIITPDLPIVRKRLHEHYKLLGYIFRNLISPYAHVSKTAQIGNGVVIQSGVNVSSNVFIGNFVKINSNANVMHDSIIGDFSTVAPNAVILGRVNIGELTYIGANCTILPGINIGTRVTVGVGAVVTKNIDDNLTVVGNPATILRR